MGKDRPVLWAEVEREICNGAEVAVARPKTNGDGAGTTVYIKPYLEKPIEQYLKRHEVKISALVNRALRRFLSAEMGDDPAFWEDRNE